MEPVDEILERALQLSSQERGKIVAILIRSLDPPGEDISEEEWEKAWSAEIQRRLDAVDRGEIVMEDWRDVLSRLEKSATGLQAK
ncbi:MAG: addiction module protein [Planctomycetes bacterium]|nr:addiction module protein [Planctomycetota bacterium]